MTFYIVVDRDSVTTYVSGIDRAYSTAKEQVKSSGKAQMILKVVDDVEPVEVSDI